MCSDVMALTREEALQILPKIVAGMEKQEWKDWEYPQEWSKFKNRVSAKAEEREKRGDSDEH